ncbi:hypothetical protein NPIL_481971 [Nephila pilipes]|uniref:Uncharacterized protein n=2 Tax=Nephila pilipes TaxID=299642 RepID=A0A8X6Q172_NEPPI|nr:hypothetical protein NPIL_481971 [Nephila pilipes]
MQSGMAEELDHMNIIEGIPNCKGMKPRQDLSCRSQARIKRERWRESDSEHRDSTDPTRWERESLQAPEPVTRKTEKMSRRVDGPAPVSEPLEEQTKGDFDFLHIP